MNHHLRIDVLSVPEGRLEIQEHAELFEKNWHRDVAVKRHNLAVFQMKDVATGGVHLPSGRGNYTLGLKEQLIFPEIKYDSVASIHGMDITFVTSAITNDEGKALLRHLGMPFRT